MDELTLAVVGLQHANADKSDRRFEALLCAPGDPVHLVREPKNKHDRLAIAVWSERWVQLGYLQADRCALIGSKMASDTYVAIFQGLERHSAYIRVRFGGDRPTPPPARPAPIAAALNEDFAPDPDGPEWGA